MDQLETILVCFVCKFWTKYAGAFHDHHLTKHNVELGFRCSVCDFRSRHRSSIYEHIRKTRQEVQDRNKHSAARALGVYPIPDHQYADFRRAVVADLSRSYGYGYEDLVAPEEADDEPVKKKIRRLEEKVDSLLERIAVMEEKVRIAKEEERSFVGEELRIAKESRRGAAQIARTLQLELQQLLQ